MGIASANVKLRWVTVTCYKVYFLRLPDLCKAVGYTKAQFCKSRGLRSPKGLHAKNVGKPSGGPQSYMRIMRAGGCLGVYRGFMKKSR